MRRFLPALAASGRLRRAPTRIVVVIAGQNPTHSYFLAPRLVAIGGIPAQVIDISAAPSPAEAGAVLDGAFVLFCRYMSGEWLAAVEARRDSISGVGLFVDDDFEALVVDRSIPLWYRLRLLRLHLVHRRRLARICDVLLVASGVLAARHATAHPFVLTPLASDEDAAGPATGTAGVRAAFHSTSVHAAEHRWLRPVIGAALESEPSLSFEVVAGAPLSWQWRGLPRTRIAPSAAWPRHRLETRARGADLLLVPLLPTAANAARSWTKRIDAMRLGAALLVSDPLVYRPDPEEQQLGMCVPPDPQAWTAAIRALARDPSRLARLRELNRVHVMRASAAPLPLLTESMLPQTP